MKSLKKYLSVLVSIVFFTQNLAITPAFSAPQSQLTDFKISELQVPESLGRIESFYQGKDSRSVLLIQDAHAEFEAQMSIQKLIQQFVNARQINLIGVEGAEGELEKDLLASYPDSKTLSLVIQEFMEKDGLSGAVAASVLGASEAHYVGLENTSLYHESVYAFLRALPKRELLLKEWSENWENLEAEKQRIYPATLKELDSLLTKMGEDEGHQSLEKLFQFLSSHQFTISPKKFPTLYAFQAELLKNEKNESEIKECIKKLESLGISANLNKENLQMLRSHKQDYQIGTISDLDYLHCLTVIAENSKLQKADIQTAKLILENRKHIQDLKPADFLLEVEEFSKEIKSRFFKQSEEKKLQQKTEPLLLEKRLIQHSLSYQGWKKIQSQKFVQSKNFDDHRAFYENAEKRDEILFQNALKTMKARNQNQMILVAGGFHTQGLAEHFRKQNISYAVITPALKNISSQNRYSELMQGKVTWADEFVIKEGSVDLYASFMNASIKRLMKTLRASYPMMDKRYFLKNWQAALYEKLLLQNEIVKAAEFQPFFELAVNHLFTQDELAEVKKNWMKRVDFFLKGLEELKSKQNVNVQSMTKLLHSSTAISLTAIPYAVPTTKTGFGIEPQRLAAAASSRSELRFANPPELVPFVHDKNADGHFYPDWLLARVIAHKLSEAGMADDNAVSVDQIKEAVIKEARGMGLGTEESKNAENVQDRYGKDVIDARVDELLGRMEKEFKLIKKQDSGWVSANEYQFLIQMADVSAIQKKLETDLSNPETLKKEIEKLSKAVSFWSFYRTESAYPVLKAVCLLSEESSKKMLAAIEKLVETKDAIAQDDLFDAIYYLLTNKIQGDWMTKFAGSIIGSNIYYISPETWLAAGGLGRVGQYHTIAARLFLKDKASLITIEPEYSHRIKITATEKVVADESGEKREIAITENLAEDVDYTSSDMAVPLKDKKRFAQFELFVTKRGKREKVTVDVSKATNEYGMEVILFRDLPDGSEKDSYFTKVLYGNPRHGNAPSHEFTEFASKAALKITKILEKEKQKNSNALKPPVLWANDGQMALLPLFKLISDDLEDMTEFERERVLTDATHPYHYYRDLIQKEGEPSLKNATVLQTTHTYRNRVIFGITELEGLKLPPRYHDYLASGEYKYLGYRNYQSAYDATSAGVRPADIVNGVAATHTQEVRELDRGAPLFYGNTNGDDLKRTAEVWIRIFTEKFPNEDPFNPSKEAFKSAKEEAKRRLRDNAKLGELNPLIKELDENKILFAYSGRCVDEKVGRTRAAVDDNIRELVRSGRQIVFLANVQPGNEPSAALYREMKALEKELLLERQKAKGSEQDFGLFVVITGFGIPEQRYLLAAEDIQINDSDRDAVRGTEAAGYTEMNGLGILVLTSPFLEAIFQQQGIVINWDKPGSGNTIIPENDTPAAYLAAMNRAALLYEKNSDQFLDYQLTSLRIRKVLAAPLTAGNYLRIMHDGRVTQNEPERLWEQMDLWAKDNFLQSMGWVKDQQRRKFSRIWSLVSEKEKETTKNLAPPKLEEIAGIFNTNALFSFWVGDGRFWGSSDPGAAGFIQTIKRYNETNPELLIQSLRHHSARGDFFAYLLGAKDAQGEYSGLGALGKTDGLRPVYETLKTYARAAETEEDLNQKIKWNIQALVYLDLALKQISANLLQAYLEETPSGNSDQTYSELFNNTVFTKYVASGLRERLDVKELPTSARGVTGFLTRDNKIIFLNTGEIAEDQHKVRFSLRSSEVLRALENRRGGWILKDGVSRSKLFSAHELTSHGLEVRGIKVLSVEEKTHSLLVALPSQGTLWQRVQALKKALLEKDDKALGELLPEDPDIRARFYSEQEIPKVMALVAGLAPEELDRIQSWDEGYYNKLKSVVIENKSNARLMNYRVPTFLSSSRDQVIAFSYSINDGPGRTNTGKNIVFVIDFQAPSQVGVDGRSWTISRDLSTGVKLDDGTLYRIDDLVTGAEYNPRTGAQLNRHWDVGIPAADGFAIYRFDNYNQDTFPSSIIPQAAPRLTLSTQELEILSVDVRDARFPTADAYTADVLKEIKTMGINTIVFKNLIDTKQDEKELFSIVKSFGSKENFEQLVQRAKEYGIKIILEISLGEFSKGSRFVRKNLSFFTDDKANEAVQFNFLRPETWQFLKTEMIRLARLTAEGGVYIRDLDAVGPEIYRSKVFNYFSPADFTDHMAVIASLVFQGKGSDSEHVLESLFRLIQTGYPRFKILGMISSERHGYWQRAGVHSVQANYVADWIVREEKGGWQAFKSYLFNPEISEEYRRNLLHSLGSFESVVETLKQKLGGDESEENAKLWAKLLFTTIATIPGAPVFTQWSDFEGDEKEFFTRLLKETDHPAFRKGGNVEFVPILSGGNNGELVFVRRYGNQAALVVLNHSGETVTLNLDLSGIGQGQEKIVLEPWATKIEFFSNVPNSAASARSEIRSALPPTVYNSSGRMKWQKDLRHTVVSLAISNLRSKRPDDPGIGKWTDLTPENLDQEGADVVHLLPHHGIAPGAESPYSSVDHFSVNELYIDWSKVKEVLDSPEKERLLSRLVAPLDKRAKVDFEDVRAREWQVAEAAYAVLEKNQGERKSQLDQFISQHGESWLNDYAEFMSLLEISGIDFSKWREPENSEKIRGVQDSPEFKLRVKVHQYAQWIGYGQAEKAVRRLEEAGKRVMFDLPAFSGVTSVDAWKHPEYFKEGNPGIVRDELNENWGDLKLWNWTKLRELGYEPRTKVLKHWASFGNPKPGTRLIRLDALHLAWNNGNGQLASGDEDGDHYVSAMARAAEGAGAVVFAEAYENRADSVQASGIHPIPGFSHGVLWHRESDHDDSGPNSARFSGGFSDFLQNFNRFVFDPFQRGQIIWAFGIGHSQGPQFPHNGIKKMTLDPDGTTRSLWGYRIPDRKDRGYTDQARFDARPWMSARLKVAQALEAGDGWDDPAVQKAMIPLMLSSTGDFTRRRADGGLDIWAAAPPSQWFHEPWGRDTFISMAGILLTAGRFEEAKRMIEEFARFETGGLIPNRIWPQTPETQKIALDLLKRRNELLAKKAAGSNDETILNQLRDIDEQLQKHPYHGGLGLEYNNADGSLWFVRAIEQYVEYSGDLKFAQTMRPVIEKIVDAYHAPQEKAIALFHRNGQRHEIYSDTDELLVQPPQASWMDAQFKRGDELVTVTPRNGKTVEGNALFYKAVRFLEELEQKSGNEERGAKYQKLGDKIKRSFSKFWNPDFKNGGYSGAAPLLDVIDGDWQGGTTRPNMLWAVLTDLLTPEQKWEVVNVATRKLLTAYGLRTLSPEDPHHYLSDYAERQDQAQETGDNSIKDEAYHQGSVWPWLIGVYVDALKEVWTGTDEAFKERLKEILSPLVEYWMTDPSLGIPEVFNPGHKREVLDEQGRILENPSFIQRPAGTPKQAWSAAELFRVLVKYGLIDEEKVKGWNLQVANIDGVKEETFSQEHVQVALGAGHLVKARVYAREGVLPAQLTVQVWTSLEPLEHWGADWKEGRGIPMTFSQKNEDGSFEYTLDLNSLESGKWEYKVRAAIGIDNPHWIWSWTWADTPGNGQIEVENVSNRSELRLVLGALSSDGNLPKRFSVEAKRWGQNENRWLRDAAGQLSPAGLLLGRANASSPEDVVNKKPLSVFLSDLENAAKGFLDHDPNRALRFAFEYPYSPLIGNELLAYFETIANLQKHYEGRVVSRIRLIASNVEMSQNSEFFERLKSFSEVVSVFEGDFQHMPGGRSGFLNNNPNALIYSDWLSAVAGEDQRRFVDLGTLMPHEALPAALILSSTLAFQPERLRAEELEKLTQELLRGAMTFNGRQWMMNSRVHQLELNFRVGELISSMA